MAVREKSPLLEASEALRDYRNKFAEKKQRKAEVAAKEQAKIEEQVYFGTKEERAKRQRAYSEFATNVRNEILGDVIKGIYIGALQENTALTENGICLAESLVENFIKESNGAVSVLSKISGKTYALDYIKSVVEGTVDSILEDVDPENPESMEVPEEKKEEMYDDLSKEEDINKAVQLIAQRVTDAEEEFIKKNNEDKKALEDIATRFNERIKKVEDDVTVEDEDKEELQQESSRLAKRLANNVRESKSRNVFEQVVINLTTSILKDKNLREEYTSEEGKLDMGSVIESAKCIYGFLETVNTLKLNNVDAKYIQEALSTM